MNGFFTYSIRNHLTGFFISLLRDFICHIIHVLNLQCQFIQTSLFLHNLCLLFGNDKIIFLHVHFSFQRNLFNQDTMLFGNLYIELSYLFIKRHFPVIVPSLLLIRVGTFKSQGFTGFLLLGKIHAIPIIIKKHMALMNMRRSLIHM